MSQIYLPTYKTKSEAGYSLQCCLQCQKGEANPISYRELVKQTLQHPPQLEKKEQRNSLFTNAHYSVKKADLWARSVVVWGLEGGMNK